MMGKRVIVFAAALLLMGEALAFAQADRKEVRSGNRKFRKENYKEADIAYRKALVKDSLSLAANYNLANVLYRGEQYEEASKAMEKIGGEVDGSAYSADYHYNVGDIALAAKDYAAAAEAFKASLLLRPDDLDAKENYIYAVKMMKDQQGGGGGGENQQGQDESQDNGGGDGEDRQDNGKDKDEGSGENEREQQPQGGEDGRQRQQGQTEISPQQAQQMLRAIQAKEKATQDKVNKEKTAILKSKQKEKNW